MVPVEATLEIKTEKKWLEVHLYKLLEMCTKSTVFTYKGITYEQTDGIAMGSRLAPVFANIFMECFEEQALQYSNLKPKMWLRYVDDTFIQWQHGEEELKKFLPLRIPCT